MYLNVIAKGGRQPFANQRTVIDDYQAGKCRKGVQFVLMEIGIGY
jgi:hypothetical protein